MAMDNNVTRKISKNALRVLVVDQDATTASQLNSLAATINDEPCIFEPCTTFEEAQNLFAAKRHDLFMIGESVSGHSAIDIIQEGLAKHRRAATVLVLSKPNEKLEHDALRLGAYDALIRDGLTSERLVDCIEVVLQRYSRLRKDSAEFDKGFTTDLGNLRERYEFRDKAEAMIRQMRLDRKPLSFLFLDIDNFQTITAKLGDLKANDARTIVSDAINQVASKNDIIGRYGGEEFCVVMPDIRADKAYEVAEELRALVAKSEYVTISIGIAELTDSMRDLADLIVHADRAMYRAKQKGRNRVITAKISKESLRPKDKDTSDTAS